jgi:PKD repeat protein
VARYVGNKFFQQLERFVSNHPRPLIVLLGLIAMASVFEGNLNLTSPALSSPDLANTNLFLPGDRPEHLALGTGSVYGYASARSVVQGGSIDFHISTGIDTYDIRIFREGGDGLIPMMTINDLPGASYPCQANEYGAPIGVPAGYENEQLGCNWPVAYTLQVPTDWPSGIYLANLLDADDPPGGYGYYIFFIVTEDEPGSTSKTLYQASTNTWQAYNHYGQWSLYAVNSNPPARRVTFDRPFDICNPYGLYGCHQYRWEIPIARWLEYEGYPVEYVTNEDIHADPTLLYNYKLLIIAGHDEYWTKELRDNIDAFIDAGGNVAVLSGNTGYRQVRYEDEGHTLVCYKYEDRMLDPLYGVENIRVATAFATDPVNWPENSTTGLGWRNGGWVNEPPGSEMAGRYTVYRSGHWVYEGTGLQDGDEFWYEPNQTVEVDGALFTWENGLPVVTGGDNTPLNFTILGLQPATQGHATMGIYNRDGGGTVFNAATMGWGFGLWPEYNPDDYEIVRQITRNVIDTLSNGDPTPEPTYAITGTAFSYQPTQLFEGDTVTFSAVITPFYATPPVTYTWYVGDLSPVTTSASGFISHTYETSGTYTVVLTAANVTGQDTYSQVIVVNPPVYPIDDVWFTYTAASMVANEVVTFTAAITPVYASLPITYVWDFGDNSFRSHTINPPLSGQNVVSPIDVVSHTYQTPGLYTVVLTVTDAIGEWDTYNETLVIVPKNNQLVPHHTFLPFVIKGF